MVRFAEVLTTTVALAAFIWRWGPLIRRATTLRASILAWAVGSSVFLGLGVLAFYFAFEPRFSVTLVPVAFAAGAASGAFWALTHWHEGKRDHTA